MKKIAIAVAFAVVALGMASSPVSAGLTNTGSLVITPDPVEQGGSTTIANGDDIASICEGTNDIAADVAFDHVSRVHLTVVDPNGATFFDQTFNTDINGNWDHGISNLTTLGVYHVTAQCQLPPLSAGFDPATPAPFAYVSGDFEVIAQQVTPTTPTTLAPTTTTTAAVAAVAATPTFTG